MVCRTLDALPACQGSLRRGLQSLVNHYEVTILVLALKDIMDAAITLWYCPLGRIAITCVEAVVERLCDILATK